MANERLRPKKVSEQGNQEQELRAIQKHDHISTWQELSPDEAEGYKEHFHQGADEDPDKRLDEQRLRGVLSNELKRLTPLESMVLRLRFNLSGVEPMTADEIEHCFRASPPVRARVRLLEAMGPKIKRTDSRGALFDEIVLFLLGKSDGRGLEVSFSEISGVFGFTKQAFQQAETRALSVLRYSGPEGVKYKHGEGPLTAFVDAPSKAKRPISSSKVEPD